MRAANAFGWDVLAAYDMVFRQENGRWSVEKPIDVESDWAYARLDPTDDSPGATREENGGHPAAPLVQRNAWFWEEDQILPHAISSDVYKEIAHQVKVSTFLFLQTDANELLHIGDIPNRERPFRVLSALRRHRLVPSVLPLALRPRARPFTLDDPHSARGAAVPDVYRSPGPLLCPRNDVSGV